MKTRYRQMDLDFRVYPEIEGVEIEVDLQEIDFNYKTQRFSGTGLIMEGHMLGRELHLFHEEIEELVKAFEQQNDVELF